MTARDGIEEDFSEGRVLGGVEDSRAVSTVDEDWFEGGPAEESLERAFAGFSDLKLGLDRRRRSLRNEGIYPARVRIRQIERDNETISRWIAEQAMDRPRVMF